MPFTMTPKFAAHLKILHRQITTHGHSRTAVGRATPEYTAWHNMIQRCHNPNHPCFRLYGALGKEACPRWHTFSHFIEDMGLRPSPKHTLERIDNSRGYSPDNCRWATRHDQATNRTGVTLFDFRGERLCLTDIATRVGLLPTTLKYRLRRSASIEEAIHAYPYRRQPRHKRQA